MLNTSLKVSVFGLSDIGLVREKNEDAWKALPDGGLFLLADGMGGHQGGSVAAQLAVTQMGEALDNIEAGEIVSSIERVNQAIYKTSQSDAALSGMGTTLCCLYLHEDEATLAHVGDSRIYRLRGKELEQLTEDHSLVSELKSMGALNDQDTETFPYKHILTRALGTNPIVEVSHQKIPLKVGDLFLLCSDGLTNFVSDTEILDILSKEALLERGAFCLIDLAKKHGGGDNITVLLVRIEPR